MRTTFYSLSTLQPASRASEIRNLYQNTVMGTVAKCHNECASMTRLHGGKSKSSSEVASMVRMTKSAAAFAYDGR